MWPPSEEFIHNIALKAWQKARGDTVVLVYANEPSLLILEPKAFAPTRYATRRVDIHNCDVIVYVGEED